MSYAVQAIVPENENHWLALRTQDVTSTDVPSLFDCSPYCTYFEMFHRKRDRTLIDFESNERMKWGIRLQDAIAFGIAEDEGWEKPRRIHRYMRIEELRMGSSFDYSLGREGLLEIKNVDSLAFRDGWVETENGLEAPPHIELQIQHQLAVTGKKYIIIGALVGGNKRVLIKREPDSKIQAAIFSQIANFWEKVEKNQAPDPDFIKDAEFIAKLHGLAEPGKLLDATQDQEILQLAINYREASERIKEFENQKKSAKAMLLTKIGEAEKVLGETFSISAGMIEPTVVESFQKQGYRNFRINWKKEGKK